MLDGLNQHELLALIDGELPAGEAHDLRSRLAAYPGALETVDLMIQDRDSLRRDPAPALGEDVVAPMEPLIARTMLLGDQPVAAADVQALPGRYRARHEHSQRSAIRFLAAACLLFGIGAGAWIVAQSLMQSPGKTPSNVTTNIDSPEGIDANHVRPGERLAASELRRDEPQGGPVHHWKPVDLDVDSILARKENENTPRRSEREYILPGSDRHAIIAPFTIAVARSDLRESVLMRIGELVSDMETASLVRNFTYEEAAAAWRQMGAKSGFRDKDELVVVMGDWHGQQRLNPRQRSALNRASRTTNVELGEQLAGDPHLAAPAQQQLSFVDRGAEHTVTLPAEYLLPFLEQLAEEFGPEITLERLPEAAGSEEAGGEPATLNTWQRWSLWRDAVDQFDFAETDDDELMVVLPIS